MQGCGARPLVTGLGEFPLCFAEQSHCFRQLATHKLTFPCDGLVEGMCTREVLPLGASHSALQDFSAFTIASQTEQGLRDQRANCQCARKILYFAVLLLGHSVLLQCATVITVRGADIGQIAAVTGLSDGECQDFMNGEACGVFQLRFISLAAGEHNVAEVGMCGGFSPAILCGLGLG